MALLSIYESGAYRARIRILSFRILFHPGGCFSSCELSEVIQCFNVIFARSEVADCEYVFPHALPQPVQANLP